MKEYKYNNKPVGLYELRGSGGLEARITNFGARIVSLSLSDKEGKRRDVVQGFDNIEDYYPETMWLRLRNAG